MHFVENSFIFNVLYPLSIIAAPTSCVVLFKNKLAGIILGSVMIGSPIIISEWLCPYAKAKSFCTYEALEIWPIWFIMGLLYCIFVYAIQHLVLCLAKKVID